MAGKDLLKTGVIDDIIPEPLGGAHRYPLEAAYNLSAYIFKTIRELKRCKIENLLEKRYQKIRCIGQFQSEQGTMEIEEAPVCSQIY